MIAYHGGPFSDPTIAAEIWRKHHAMISFARPEQLDIAAEFASSFALDNGAFSLWRAGQRRPAWDTYYRWVGAWRSHPGFDFAVIPDVIDGTEEENDDLLAEWPFFDGVPVYHLHESLDRLVRLTNSYSRSTRIEWSVSQHLHPLGRDRMLQIMTLLCDDGGLPTVELHGLRMLARNVNRDVKWSGTFAPRTKAARAITLRDRVEDAPCAMDLELEAR